MKMNRYFIDNNYQVLQGRSVKAQYIKQELNEYKGNPYIEALPPISSWKRVIEETWQYPDMPEALNDLKPEIRFQAIGEMEDLYIPPPEIVDTERHFSQIIRRGYIGRNPLIHNLQLIKRLNDSDCKDFEMDEQNLNLLNQANSRTTAKTLTLLGTSGMGKTTMVEKLLLRLPQVIYHSEYNGQMFTRTQIVWMKIDCPPDGSINTLCKMFFAAVDNVLKTTSYARQFGGRRSAGEMQKDMARIATLHGIGVLVIDEIQHLLIKKAESERIMNFLVTLVNTVGVPLCYIGTPKTKSLFADMRQARRMATEGVMTLEPMKPHDKKWDSFLKNLWSYQYLLNKCELNETWQDAMYYYSQGITAVTIQLFMLIQKRAINSDEEKMTLDLLKTVYDNELAVIKPIIDALRSGNAKEIAKYEDVDISFKRIMNDTPYTPAVSMDAVSELIDQKLSLLSQSHTLSKPLSKSQRKQAIAQHDDDSLLKVYRESKEDNRDIHEALLEKGFIKPFKDEMTI